MLCATLNCARKQLQRRPIPRRAIQGIKAVCKKKCTAQQPVPVNVPYLPAFRSGVRGDEDGDEGENEGKSEEDEEEEGGGGGMMRVEAVTNYSGMILRRRCLMNIVTTSK